MSEQSSYQRIMHSSSIMGGSQAITHLVSLLRVKAVAVLLGPAGVGIVGLYATTVNLATEVTGLGLQRSAVRSIAQAHDDPIAVARAIRMLRRLCWATGIMGWSACAVLAIPLSRMIFESTAHAWAIAVLGSTVLLNAINGGQMALLRGLRRIGDIARAQVASALITTAVIVALYAWLGERGIVPVLLASAAVSLTMSWWFVRRVDVAEITMTWRQAVNEARPMVSLGVALMISSALATLLEFYTRAILSRGHGLEAVGIYQAAWSLSGMFAGFVLSAMGTDFYPRLAAVIDDRAAAAREINQQTEIGILLSLPGLLATLVFAKWVIWLLYSASFAPAGEVLVWMILGVFGRVVSWPLGYIQVAMNAKRWYLATEIFFIALQAALVAWWVPLYGAAGAAYAFFACFASYFLTMMWVAHRLLGFRHSPTARRLIAISALLLASAMASDRLLGESASLGIGAILALLTGYWCLRELAGRIGHEHSLIRKLRRLPGLARITGHRDA
ncbi:O-antigen translocase [Thermomonas mangrovi]|uniref:O-antigen translocase n=1 Tax=Thermomonas mangrovi TaxID=2993316 RepID=UPI00230824BB|nr:O-antigen translocase [Thermomonas mangrovi]